ncbi:TPA: hypothetical protein QDB32_003985 [Burkholderia vietnamiensis]|nr:hypothetical protein [Burkholderia vietnamiensis]HDR9145462.1 hypothetical protein [Burkholderia vietnamiensis]
MTDVGVGDLVIDAKAGGYAVILGNSVREDGTIWCADWESLTKKYCTVGDLRAQRDVVNPSWEDLLTRMEGKAESGDADAMWWCAWAHEGTNHPKSVWFYMAAIRRDPRKHSWAWERIYSDARHPYLCEGVQEPDLSFLETVDEFCGAREWGKWEDAITNAKVAVHAPKGSVADSGNTSRN